MTRAIVCMTLLATSFAFADPVSIKIKEGVLVRQDDTTVTVDAGLYLNEEARQQIIFVVDSLTSQNSSLINSLESANKKISECTPNIPGFPMWAGILVSSLLTIASGVVAFFAINEAGTK